MTDATAHICWAWLPRRLNGLCKCLSRPVTPGQDGRPFGLASSFLPSLFNISFFRFPLCCFILDASLTKQPVVLFISTGAGRQITLSRYHFTICPDFSSVLRDSVIRVRYPV